MSERSRVPEARIYVANLSYAMSVEDVVELFEEVGDVIDVYLPRQRGAEHHRGYGFVEMASAEEAQDAIEDIHGTEDYYGRVLTVRIADRDQNH